VRQPDGSVHAGATVRPTAFKTVAQGAATTFWCATSPRLAGMGGVYCENCDIAEVVPGISPGDMSLPTGMAPWACDPEAAQRLWALSERLTDTRLDLGGEGGE
jgi:hypothetical protein